MDGVAHCTGVNSDHLKCSDYGEDGCHVSVSNAFPNNAELHFETETIDFSKAKVITEDMGVIKKVIEEGEVIEEGKGWELLREPYELKAWISAKTGDGKMIVSHTHREPFFFTLGKSEVSKGLEMGIGTMSRGEKAVIYVRDMLGDGRLIKRRIRDGKGATLKPSS